jgi:hypothetical protein
MVIKINDLRSDDLSSAKHELRTKFYSQIREIAEEKGWGLGETVDEIAICLIEYKRNFVS